MANRPSITEQFDPEQIYQISEEYLSVVGRRQYIGARYVPIFGRVGEDSIYWDNTAPYEPLTIVLYQGNSYTSRQYVPTGIDIYNEDFWANTGNYNAQIEAYRREVAALAQEMSTYEDAINAIISSIENINGLGVTFEVGKNSKCVYTVFTIPKDNFTIDIDLLSGSTEQTASVYEYALRNNDAFLAMNCSAGNGIIWDHQMVNSTDWELEESNGCMGLLDNGEIFTISGTGHRWSEMLVCDKAFACWQVLVEDGIAQTIGGHSTFATREPRQTLAWDDDNWYVYTVYGRFSGMFGLTMEECRSECLERGWPNAIAFDGGGSNQVFGCQPARAMSPIIDGDQIYRSQTVCVVFRKKEES